MQDDLNHDESALRPGEVAIALPAAPDADLYFIGTICTPWRVRSECPKRGSPDGPICSIMVDERWSNALADIAQHKRIQVLYWMHRARRDLVLQTPYRTRETTSSFALRSPLRPNPIASSCQIPLPGRPRARGSQLLDRPGSVGADVAQLVERGGDSLQDGLGPVLFDAEQLRQDTRILRRCRVQMRDGEVDALAGSLSHMVPMTPGSPSVDHSKMPSLVEMSDAFHELAQLLKAAGAELILLEMMYHPERAKLAVEAALATGLPVWFGLSARRAKDGRVMSYHQSEELPLDEIARLIPRTGIDAAGPMHTNSEVITDALSTTRKHFSGALMTYPGSGYFEMPNWRFVDVIAPERFEAFCQEWIKAGVQVLAGCCGLTAEHIEAAARARAAVRTRF